MGVGYRHIGYVGQESSLFDHIAGSKFAGHQVL
jgi:hypothetical protein